MSLPLRYSLANLRARKSRVLLTAGVIGTAVLTVTLVGALVSGIKHALVASGNPDNLIVLRKGAENEGSSWLPLDVVQVIASSEGVARTRDDQPLISPELIVQPSLEAKTGKRENVLVRGVRPSALALHEQVDLVDGRMFHEGTSEAVIGRSVVGRYAGAKLGGKLRFGEREWQIVGVFDSAGSSFDSEIWTDVAQLGEDARRLQPFSALYVRAESRAARGALKAALEADPRLAVSVHLEDDYYRERAKTANALYALLVLIALLSGTSSAIGATNTLHASVQARLAEIGTLRAIGFSRGAILNALLRESLLISLLGFLGGALAAALLGELVRLASGGVGIPSSTFSTLVVELRVGGVELAIAFVLACVVGLLGGLAPALRGARLAPAEAHRCR